MNWEELWGFVVFRGEPDGPWVARVQDPRTGKIYGAAVDKSSKQEATERLRQMALARIALCMQEER